MASIITRWTRLQSTSRKPKRKFDLFLERLEERLNLAADLLVTTTIAVSEQVLREFTPSGELVRTALLTPVSGSHEPGRDLVFDQSGKVHVFGGTFDPALCSYTLDGGGWTQRTHAGWSTINNVSNGGIGQWGDYIYVTDMTTFGGPGDEAKGVVRFNLADGTSARFLETEAPQDLTIGHDGRLYLLAGNTVKSYDPSTFTQLSTVTLPVGDFRGIAVNSAGDIFAVNFEEQVYHLSASGSLMGVVTLSGVSDPMDIDLSGEGRVAIGTVSGHVVQMNEALTGITTFAAGTQRAFVAFGPDETQSPAGPTPPTATLSSDIVQAEGNSDLTTIVFTLTLSAPSVDPIAFRYTPTGGTATPLVDYWSYTETRVMLAGQTSAQIYVNILGDTLFEPDETFSLVLSDPVGVTLADTSRQVTIANDDSSTPYFIVDDLSQGEGAQFATTTDSFLVKLSTPTSQTVTLNYATHNGTATAGSDYSARSGTLTFAPGQLEQVVDITVRGDATVEPDETFFFELSGATNANITDSQAIGTIVNDDWPFLISVDGAFGFEGHGEPASVDFTIRLNQASPVPIAVDYLTYPNDATPYVDFVPTSGTAVFAPGQTSQIVSVPILGDTEIEADETLYLVLQNPIGAPLADEYYALGTIGNDDSYPGNNAPLAADDYYDLAEDYPLDVYSFDHVLSNDSDPDYDFLTAVLVSGPAHGTLFFDASGVFSYMPDENYFGPDSFVYRAVDTGGLSSLATVSLTVWGMDDLIDLTAPGSQTTAEDTPVTFSWSTDNPVSVTDIDSPRVMVALLAQNGILTLPSIDGLEFPDPNSTNNSPYITFYADNPDEANAALDGLIFTPTENFYGTAYLDVLVADLGSGSYYEPTDYATVPIVVTPVNDAPVAVDDFFEGYEDYPLEVTSFGVFANDYDVDGAVITAELASGPAHGTVTLHPWGHFTYTPAPNYFGPDSFTYRMSDGELTSAPATVSLIIHGLNDAIEAAAPGPLTIAEDGSITFSADLGNAFTVTDVESPRVLVDLLTQNGILTLPSTVGLEFPDPARMNNGPNLRFYADNPAEANAALDGLIFTPDANFNGQTYLTILALDTTATYPPFDAFDYTQITVSPVNDAPVAVDDSYAAEAGAPFWATLGGGGGGVGVLMNDQDVDWDLITAVLVSGPAHGTLEFNADGTFTYTADSTYSGTDSFTYRASDGQAQSNLATATFTVTQINYAPVAVGDSYSVNEDSTLSIAAPGVLGNDWDNDNDPLAVSLVSGPAHGTVNLNADGSFTYTPSANYNGSDSFSYKSNDGQVDSNVANVFITVNAVNDAPLAVNDVYSINEDQTLTIALIPGVTSLTMVSQPGDYIGQGQTYSYTPATGTFFANRNFDNGVSIFYAGGGHDWHLDFAAPLDANLTPGTYLNATRWPFQAASVPGLNVSGDGRGSNTLTGNFTVTQALYAADGKVLRFAATFEQHSEGLPPALTGEIKINQGGGPSGILLNDSDAEGSPLTIILVAGPQHGTLSLNVDGSFIYTPAANYNGADSFSYKLSDGISESNVATVALTVNAVNDFPTANPDSYTVAEDAVLTVASPGVLSNDSDVDGDSLTATLVTSTTHGSLVFNSNGSFTYTPQANYNGSDSVQYAARDSSGWFSFIRTVTLTVTSVNDAPVAAGDSYTTAEDSPLTVAAAGVLANDSDVEGTALSAVLISGPAHGTLTLNSNGSFTYTPEANYHGPDSFSYRASDGGLSSNVAAVSLTVSSVNDAPSAADDAYTALEDQPLVVAAAGVLANDGDADGDSISAVLVSGPAHGTLTLNSDGSFNYAPGANYHGSDSFTYQASDDSSSSNVATVTLTIDSVNDVPTATDDTYVVDEDQSLVVATPGVLANDADADGDSLTAVLVGGPAHGTLTLNSDGSFTYTPAANYDGSDSFTYQASDGNTESNFATVSLTVGSVNDAPTAADDAYAVDEDQSLVITAAGILANDGDADGDSLNAVLVSGPAHGTLSLNADGSFTYTPDANYYGSDSFAYEASDGDLSTAATVTLTVASVNDSPLVDAAAGPNASEGSAVAFASTASDADGDSLSYLWDFGDGATATTATPTHVYADNGSYTVTLTVSDGHGGVASDSLVVTVQNVVPTLMLSGDSAVNEASPYTLNLAASDPGTDTIASWTITWGDGSVQTVTGNPSSVSHSYADGTQTYAITAIATDEDGTYDAANTQSVTVNNVAPTASLIGPATGARGQLRNFAVGAVDPSAIDQNGAFTFAINWGDGSSESSTGPASQQAGHVFTTAGVYTVKITATDKDGGQSALVQQTITISAVDLQSGVLVIGGTTGDDSIAVAPTNAQGILTVTINGANQGNYATPAQIVIYGQAGNDQLKLNTKKIGPTTYYVTAPAVLFGDAGNDTLDARGSSANNILVGGAGSDSLQGGSDRDLLFGGSGGDTLHGNGGDDLVIGNATDFDAQLDALIAFLAEWDRADADYLTRISHLTSGGGLNGGYVLNSSTVHDDAAVDQLYGDAGSDWFFHTAAGSNKDRLNDIVSGEVATAQ